MKYLIETKRLYLRELKIDDTENLMRVLSDDESMKYYPHTFSRIEVEKWIHWNINNYNIYGFGLWAIVRKKDEAFLGDCGITIQIIENEKLPEIGFHVIKEYCNNGYASEAAKACIEYTGKKFGIKTIYSYCNIENFPSIRVMERIGMKQDRIFYYNGKEKIVYSKRIY